MLCEINDLLIKEEYNHVASILVHTLSNTKNCYAGDKIMSGEWFSPTKFKIIVFSLG